MCPGEHGHKKYSQCIHNSLHSYGCCSDYKTDMMEDHPRTHGQRNTQYVHNHFVSMHHNSNSCQTKKNSKKSKISPGNEKKFFTCALSSSDDLYSVLGDKYINLQ